MKRKLFVLFLMVSVAVFFIPGCGSDDDDNGGSPTGGGSATDGSLAEHTGANTVVTQDNVAEVTNEINGKAMEVFGRAMETITYGKAAAGVTYNLDGDVDGLNSGKAVVKGKVVSQMDGSSSTYDFTCTYYDFSDDGELYLGGSMTYKGTVTLNTSTYQMQSSTLTIKGGLKFNGTYSGTETISLTITSGSDYNYSYTGSTTVTSGGETFTYNYDY